MKRYAVCFWSVCLLLCVCACGQKATTEDVSVNSWQEQYDLGIRYLSEGNYQEAIIAFTAAIEIDPKLPEAYMKASEAYIASGDLESARAILMQGVELTGDDSLNALIEELRLEQENEKVAVEVIPDGYMHHQASLESGGQTVMLDVQAWDERSGVITLSGLTLQSNYLTNATTSMEDQTEYSWEVEFVTPEDTYIIATACWAAEPGVNKMRTIASMQHTLWHGDKDGGASNIADAEMENTANSITWSFKVPEEYLFDFADVTEYNVGIYNWVDEVEDFEASCYVP